MPVEQPPFAQNAYLHLDEPGFANLKFGRVELLVDQGHLAVEKQAVPRRRLPLDESDGARGILLLNLFYLKQLQLLDLPLEGGRVQNMAVESVYLQTIALLWLLLQQNRAEILDHALAKERVAVLVGVGEFESDSGVVADVLQWGREGQWLRRLCGPQLLVVALVD